MTRLSEDLLARLGRLAASEGVELLAVEVGGTARRPVVRLLLDRDEGGVTLADCESVSRQASVLLDAHDPFPGAFTLEVSSPGIDRKLYGEKDFARFEGHAVRVRMRPTWPAPRVIDGVLEGYGGERDPRADTSGHPRRCPRTRSSRRGSRRTRRESRERERPGKDVGDEDGTRHPDPTGLPRAGDRTAAAGRCARGGDLPGRAQALPRARRAHHDRRRARRAVVRSGCARWWPPRKRSPTRPPRCCSKRRASSTRTSRSAVRSCSASSTRRSSAASQRRRRARCSSSASARPSATTSTTTTSASSASWSTASSSVSRRGGIVIELGRTEGIVPRHQQVRHERYSQGDRIRAVIVDVTKDANKPQVVLSRTSPQLLMKLLEMEVPEIYDGTVIDQGVRPRARRARQGRGRLARPRRRPGRRVRRHEGLARAGDHARAQGREGRHHPLLAGPRRPSPRTHWPRPRSTASRCASSSMRVPITDSEGQPAIDEDGEPLVHERVETVLDVIVSEEQLSLAIGKRGQNVRLASRLLGSRIEIKSEEAVKDEVAAALAAMLRQVEGVAGGGGAGSRRRISVDYDTHLPARGDLRDRRQDARAAARARLLTRRRARRRRPRQADGNPRHRPALGGAG